MWQLAAGDSGGRDYSKLFLEHDAMFLSLTSQIFSFYQNPKAGDIVLLRYGREVVAVGKIPNSESRLPMEQCI